jgi:membrane-associated phospholipid phosphatase
VSGPDDTRHSRAREERSHSSRRLLLVIALFVAIALASLGVGWALVHTTLSSGFDRPTYEWAIQHHTPILDVMSHPIDQNFLRFGVTPSYLNIWALLLLGYLLIFRRRDFVPVLLAFVIAFLMSSAILYLNTRFLFRARPFTVFPNQLTAAYKASLLHWTSWPSGHVRDTTIFAVITARYVPKLAWLAAIVALFVAFSRVYVGAHYPTDALGGLLLGLALGTLGVFAADSIWKWIAARRSRGTDVRS